MGEEDDGGGEPGAEGGLGEGSFVPDDGVEGNEGEAEGTQEADGVLHGLAGGGDHVGPGDGGEQQRGVEKEDLEERAGEGVMGIGREGLEGGPVVFGVPGDEEGEGEAETADEDGEDGPAKEGSAAATGEEQGGEGGEGEGGESPVDHGGDDEGESEQPPRLMPWVLTMEGHTHGGEDDDAGEDAEGGGGEGDGGEVDGRDEVEEDEGPGGGGFVEEAVGEVPQQKAGTEDEQGGEEADAEGGFAKDAGADLGEQGDDGAEGGVPEVEGVGAGKGVGFDGGDGNDVKGEEARQREEQEGGQEVGLAVHGRFCRSGGQGFCKINFI